MPSWYGRQGAALARAFQVMCRRLPVAPTAVDLAVSLERPASHWTKGGALRKGAAAWPPARVGDVDNLAKSVLDALVKAEILPDDSQVVDLRVRKTYVPLGGTPGFRLVLSAA